MTPTTEFIEGEEGAFIGLADEVYRRAKGISKSGDLDLLVDSGLDYYRTKSGLLPRAESEAMELGAMIHASILLGRPPQFHIQPETYGPEAKKWNGNATECKKWLADHADLPVMTAAEVAHLLKIIEYVNSHPLVPQVIAPDGLNELSVFARDKETGYLLKGRLDHARPLGDGRWSIVDVKTAKDGSKRAFSREILKRRYHVQAAMYRRILRKLGATEVTFTFVILDKGHLPKVNVLMLAPQAMDLGDKAIDSDLQFLRRCLIQNLWPEWRDGEPDKVGFIDLPEFMYKDIDLLEGMTEV